MDLESALDREPAPAESRGTGDASLRFIAPAPARPTTPTDYHMAQNLPKRARVGVRKACALCRSKKSRCDGIRPQCTPCLKQNARCHYDADVNQHQVNADLIRLFTQTPEKDAIDLLLRLRSTVYSESAPPSTEDSNQPEPSQAKNNQLKEKHGKAHGKNYLAKIQELVRIQKLASSVDENPSHLEANQGRHAREESPWSALSNTAFHSQSSWWTRADLDKDRVRCLFDALFELDYFSFCLMCKDQFLSDYQSGSTRYCSSSLVNALIALAIRVLSDQEEALGVCWLQDADFFDEAKGMVHAGQLNSIPDAQALGILSLYEFTYGHQAEARNFAASSSTHIAKLGPLGPLTDVEQEEWSRVQKSSYCSAVFLVRQASNDLKVDMLEDGSIALNQPFCPVRNQCDSDSPTTSTSNLVSNAGRCTSELHGITSIPERVFQLTELVYTYISVANTNGQFDAKDALAIYTKCLHWYNDVFPMLPKTENDAPLALFIHIYYHFCLLCLFQPVSNLFQSNIYLQPQNICLQAARTIIELVESYTGLFSLQRVSIFIPHFVWAAGLASITIESMHDTEVNESDQRCAQSSIADRASILLVQMSSFHPIDTLANNVF
ncbi:hypothetical protein CDD82_2845 [Ophiocordyceps australis]|uniref:Zn(2)-C6 fungal-type domain-containing protein n=1 Tax=Ophiocordyceps australis TaxID=1399860 RepID=A0A2C5ZUV6_9HYPO|nr:hypothetical protein CDD82_2845 [Ophiocordyceps australis]